MLLPRNPYSDGQFVTREQRAGANTATYLIGAGGPLYRRNHTNNTVRWYLLDGLGSVLGEVDPSGNVTTSSKYDAYGGLRTRSGTATTAHGFVGSLGHTSEAETGLIYMRARYMDPVVGRFASEDPAGDGTNFFAYCANRPSCAVDPDGKSMLDVSLQLSFGTFLFSVGFMMAVCPSLVDGGNVPLFHAGLAIALVGLAFQIKGMIGLAASGHTGTDYTAALLAGLGANLVSNFEAWFADAVAGAKAMSAYGGIGMTMMLRTANWEATTWAALCASYID